MKEVLGLSNGVLGLKQCFMFVTDATRPEVWDYKLPNLEVPRISAGKPQHKLSAEVDVLWINHRHGSDRKWFGFLPDWWIA